MTSGARELETEQGTVAKAILGRHSVRFGFEADPIHSEVVEEIVSCGLAGPS